MLSARLDRLTNSEDGWMALVDAGVLGIPFTETHGGLNLDPRDAFPVLEVLGERAMTLPFLETVLMSGLLIQKAGGTHADFWLPHIVSGKARLATAWIDDEKAPTVAVPEGDGWRITGRKLLSVCAAQADAIIVITHYDDDIAVFIISPDKVNLQNYPTIDGRNAADLHFKEFLITENQRLDLNQSTFTEILDIGTAAIVAEASAIMARLVTDTRDYCKQREQFGQPIASLQVIQHRLVDMHIAARQAAAAANLAANALSLDHDTRNKAISAAKVTVADTARFIGQNAVQLHGGMGMTEELIIAALFKRLMVIESEFGSRDDHLVRYLATA